MTRIDLRKGGTPPRQEVGTPSPKNLEGGTGATGDEHPRGATPVEELPEVLTVREAAAAAGVSVQALRRRIARHTIQSTTLRQGREEVTAIERAELLRVYSGASAERLRAVLGTGATGGVAPQAPVANPGGANVATHKTPSPPGGGRGEGVAKLQAELDAATRKAAEALAKLEQQRERAAAAEGQGQEHAKARRDAELALEQARAELVEARERSATAEAQAARVVDLEARAVRAEAQADTARQEAQGLTLTLMNAQKRILELESPTVEAGALGPVAEQLENLDRRTRWDPLAKMALGGLVVAVGGLGWLFAGSKSEVQAKTTEVLQVRSEAEGLRQGLDAAQSELVAAERRAMESELAKAQTQAERDALQAELRQAQQVVDGHQAAAMLRTLFILDR